MAININLYPPIVNTYMPAFLVDDVCRVYFSLSQYNIIEDIENVQVTLRNQNTNDSMLNRSKYPSEVKIAALKEDTSKTSNDRFYIELQASDVQGEKWEINTYYRVQLRFTKTGTPAAPSNNKLDTWLAANIDSFSEWSTVCLVRAISNPILSVEGWDSETGSITWSLANSVIIGKLVFEDEEESDSLKSYQIKLYNENKDLLTDSGLLYANNYNDINSFTYTLKYNFSADSIYSFTIDYITMAGYSDQITREFEVTQEDTEELDVSISAQADPENGRIGITLRRSGTAPAVIATYIIRRSSSKENFTIWEDMYFHELNDESAIKLTWYDMTVESDIWYKYSVQKVNEQNQRGMYKELKSPILVRFEDMFLTVGDRQLKVKFNPTVSSFKKTIQESRVDTLGSKYPYVRRNGYAEYTQFPIGGLVSFFMDEDEVFTSREKLFGDSLKLYANYNDENRIGNANNTIYERKFRDEVIDFLYEEDLKLFRSPTEGNMIVKVMEASLTPNQQLGRHLWAFTATAYEMADCTIENMRQYNILKGRDE